jgi:hypothetical protein
MPSSASPLTSFDEFWPHYVHAHRNPVNRALHYAGTTAAIGTVTAATVTLNAALLLLTPVVGYGPAWIGHFVFEKNRPATFDHPLWSLRADFKMLGMALRLKMRAEVERVCGGSLSPGHTHEDHLHLVHGGNGVNGAAEAPVA